MSKFQIKQNEAEGQIEVYTPYNSEFVFKLKHFIGGSKRWDSEKQCWLLPKDAVDDVRQLMLTVYGENDTERVERITVRLNIKDDYTNNSPKIVLFAKTIARAESRDYIGTISDGVTYISGGYVSGGSTKYPKVTIKGNSEIIIRNVPKQLFERELVPEQMTVSIEEKKSIDVKALTEERKQLKKRIAEIDKLLAKIQNNTPSSC